MIVLSFKMVDGSRIDGHEISCSGCPLTSFVAHKKHLPPEVLKKKFQERKWEVHANGKDLCPKCIDIARTKKARSAAKRAEKLAKKKDAVKLVVPYTEKFELTTSFMARVMETTGFAGAKVCELEGKLPKFKITFSCHEINVPLLLICQTEIAKKFDAEFKGSYLQPELLHVNGGSTLSVTQKLHWIVTLQKKSHDPIEDPTRW